MNSVFDATVNESDAAESFEAHYTTGNDVFSAAPFVASGGSETNNFIPEKGTGTFFKYISRNERYSVI